MSKHGKQVLFSFHVRDGEEWPSEEDDSDFDPGNREDWPSSDESESDYDSSHGSDSDNETGTSKKGKKKPVLSQRGQKGNQKKSEPTRKRKSNCTDNNKGSDVKVARVSLDEGKLPQLPPEIWLKIFHYITSTEGTLPFVLQAEKVCKQWKAILDHSIIWHEIDLTHNWIEFTEASFQKFCRNRLTGCTHLNVPGCPIMSKPSAVQAIAKNCQKLKGINLSRCNKLPKDSVVTIVNGCNLLEDIDLSATTTDSVSMNTLYHTVDKCGPNLRRLVLSMNVIRGFVQVFKYIMDKCPNLEYLDVSYVDMLTAKGYVECRPGQSSGSSITRSPTSSTKLRLLDMRGCKKFGAMAVLDSIPASHLEQLHLSHCVVEGCLNLQNILKRWRHSLTDLDISCNDFTVEMLELGLVTLCGRGEPHAPLRNLNLVGTHVTMDVVRKLLDGLPNLCKLDLTSCREVSWMYQREYKTRAELEKLRDSL